MLENYYNEKELNKYKKKIVKIKALTAEYLKNNELDLVKELLDVKNSKKDNDTKVCHAMALAEIASVRTIKKSYFDVQYMGGWTLANGGIAQMKTGEGKTLMCSLAIAANFVLGWKVHVATANEYLATRDHETLKPLFDALGISSSYNIASLEREEKRVAYSADVVYSTAQEMGFDYLRDHNVKYIEEKIQPRDFLHVASIIDEADFTLIDEARTPLIISSQAETYAPTFYTSIRDVALKLVRMAKEPEKEINGDYIYEPGDFWIDLNYKSIHFSEAGYTSLERTLKEFILLGEKENLYMPANAWLVDQVLNALKAEYTYIKDKQYIVSRDREILIIDENTGRIGEGRRWSGGLHQAVEAKEGVRVKPESETQRSITIQNYFRHYGKISGMTGTASECSDEFMETYGTTVVVIPTNKKIRRIDKKDMVYLTQKGKYKAIIDDILSCKEKGQPVLVATTTVQESEHISNLLQERDIFHYVLNAKNHALEAHIIAQAGISGSVTVATSMAGRGTDIILGGNPESLIPMREKQLAKTVQLRNYMINSLVIQKALVSGENLTPTKTNWDNIVVLEDYLAKMLEYSQGDNIHPVEEDRGHLANLARIEMFLNDKIKDIKDNWDTERTKSINAGGLYVLGCSRNDSRRVDDQIMGRAGRQGDDGVSCFYLSLEDSFFEGQKNFAFDMLRKQAENNPEMESMAMDNAFLSKTIKSNQRKKEAQFQESRKHILKFDSVINEARIQFFEVRDQIITNTKLLKEIMTTEINDDFKKLYDYEHTGNTFIVWNEKNTPIADLLDLVVSKETSIQDKNNLIVKIIQKTLNIDNDYLPGFFEMLFSKGLGDKLENNELIDDEALIKFVHSTIIEHIEAYEEEVWTYFHLNALNSLDRSWMTFLSITDEIKDSSQLSSFSQKNPVYVYKQACFDIFSDLINEYKNNLINLLLDTKSEMEQMVQNELRTAKEKELYAQNMIQQQYLRQLNSKHTIFATIDSDGYVVPESLMLDIDSTLIFRENNENLVPDFNNIKPVISEENIETEPLVDDFILDIDPSLIFKEIAPEDLDRKYEAETVKA